MIFILTNFIFDLAYTIYLRTNKVNGMQYVGQTKDFNKREYQWNNLKQRYSNKLLQEDRMNYGFGNFIRTLKSATEAGRTLGLNCSHIMSCCKGKRKTCGRFKWKYADEK